MSTFDYNMVTREKKLLKQEEVLGGFDGANYQTERLYAPARDGVEVPLSIVYRKGFVKDGKVPCLLYGYGSYGRAPTRVRLGPAEPPRPGIRLRHRPHPGRTGDGPAPGTRTASSLKKKNTFTDFIDCAEFLVAEKYTKPGRLFAEGGSAAVAHGACRQHAPGPLQRGPRRRALRRRHHDHARHVDPADDGGVRRVGESRGQGVLRLHALVLAVRPARGQEVPGHVRDHGWQDSQVQYFEPAKYVPSSGP